MGSVKVSEFDWPRIIAALIASIFAAAVAWTLMASDIKENAALVLVQAEGLANVVERLTLLESVTTDRLARIEVELDWIQSVIDKRGR